MHLVTGATGHIGNVLVRDLLARGRSVRALVLPGEDLTPLSGLELEVYPGNVLEPKSLPEAFRGVQDVYHLAGLISIMPGKNELVEQVNVDGTHNVLQAAMAAGVRRLVYTSSIHALSRAPHGVTIDEAIPFDPQHAISAYDHSKAQASLEVLESVQKGLDAVVVCPTGVIGPYDFRRSEVGQIILDCIQHKPQLYVDGAYDFVDVRDVVEGHILACERGRTGETYILSGEQLSVRKLLETMWDHTGKQFKRFKIPMALARFVSLFSPYYYRLRNMKPRFTPYSLATLTSNSTISHAKARKELGYTPRSLQESLADTMRWFLENQQVWSPAKRLSS